MNIVETFTGRQLSEWRYHRRHRRWCTHVNISEWYMANLGANKYRRCPSCKKWEWI